MLLPRFRVDEATCRAHQFTAGEPFRIPPDRTVSELDVDFPRKEATLRQVGIPPWRILQVEAGDDLHFICLAGDAGHYFGDAAPITETTTQENN